MPESAWVAMKVEPCVWTLHERGHLLAVASVPIGSGIKLRSINTEFYASGKDTGCGGHGNRVAPGTRSFVSDLAHLSQEWYDRSLHDLSLCREASRRDELQSEDCSSSLPME